MAIQAVVRGITTRVHIVHGPRAAFTALADAIAEELVTRDAANALALEAPTFRSQSTLTRPRFRQPHSTTPAAFDEAGGLDLRATAELEEELRRVRSQLALRAAAPAARPTAGGEEAGRLMALWTSIGECMVVLEDGGAATPVFLAPLEDAGGPGTPMAFPAVFSSRVRIFALTAFDPPGEARSLEDNTRENHKLAEEILTMAPRPARVWPSFGFHLREGWREDGFCLVFERPPSDDDGDAERWRLEARAAQTAAVVALAVRFRQGAVFGYEPSEDSASASAPGRVVALVRTTIPCCFDGAAPEAATLVQRVPRPGQAPRSAPLADAQRALLERPWTGPAELLARRHAGRL